MTKRGGNQSYTTGNYTIRLIGLTSRQVHNETMPNHFIGLMDDFMQRIGQTLPTRVPGTAIYMYSSPGGTPPALVQNLTHNKVLHERVVFLTVVTKEIPYVDARDRVQVEPLGEHFHRITANYGFAEEANVPELLTDIEIDGQGFTLAETTFFLGREQLFATARPGMAIWRERLFSRTARNALGATAFFHVPPERVVEVGMQIEL